MEQAIRERTSETLSNHLSLQHHLLRGLIDIRASSLLKRKGDCRQDNAMLLKNEWELMISFPDSTDASVKLRKVLNYTKRYKNFTL
jgi:hypothetical protein